MHYKLYRKKNKSKFPKMFLQMVIFLTMALLNVHMTEGAVAFGKAETHPGEFMLL